MIFEYFICFAKNKIPHHNFTAAYTDTKEVKKMGFGLGRRNNDGCGCDGGFGGGCEWIIWIIIIIIVLCCCCGGF